MSFRALTSDYSKRKKIPTMSISPKLKRITLNRESILLDPNRWLSAEYAMIFVNDKFPNVCWLKPCKGDVLGARKLEHPTPRNCTLSATALMAEVNWKWKTTSHFSVLLDKTNGALKIDMNSRIDDTPFSKKEKCVYLEDLNSINS